MYLSLTVAGRLGKDPEVRFTQGGTKVASFSVATDRKYTGSDGNQVKETIWLRVSTFGKTADAIETYLKKGAMVLVEGRLTPDKQTGGPRVFTRPDGTTGSSYEVIANVVRFLSSASDSGGQQAHPQQQQEEDVEPEL